MAVIEIEMVTGWEAYNPDYLLNEVNRDLLEYLLRLIWWKGWEAYNPDYLLNEVNRDYLDYLLILSCWPVGRPTSLIEFFTVLCKKFWIPIFNWLSAHTYLQGVDACLLYTYRVEIGELRVLEYFVDIRLQKVMNCVYTVEWSVIRRSPRIRKISKCTQGYCKQSGFTSFHGHDLNLSLGWLRRQEGGGGQEGKQGRPLFWSDSQEGEVSCIVYFIFILFLELLKWGCGKRCT